MGIASKWACRAGGLLAVLFTTTACNFSDGNQYMRLGDEYVPVDCEAYGMAMAEKKAAKARGQAPDPLNLTKACREAIKAGVDRGEMLLPQWPEPANPNGNLVVPEELKDCKGPGRDRKRQMTPQDVLEYQRKILIAGDGSGLERLNEAERIAAACRNYKQTIKEPPDRPSIPSFQRAPTPSFSPIPMK
jgi:hypothetical protein